MPITSEKYIEAVETVDNDAENIRRSGTYAYAPQTDSEKGCAAAVSYWKEAHVKLGNLPPVYEGNTDVYAESRSRSLVALYSAKDDATISCAYITCPVSITSTTTVSTPTEPTAGGEEEEEEREDEENLPVGNEGEPKSQPKPGPTARRLSTSSETITGLVCLTNPPALVQGEKPFSEEVWAGIKEAIENSASASTQSALLVTALLVFTPFIIL
ncbi:SAG family member [Eimeria mitis]|uniref:SAG family member n=1 Tax=Eimeria mitis TaxID=44415 RepID=U6JXG2_9EIME|nr:SAG family member [Eimeria mitis]CDJ28742.1 SAG family member [Eimeria mitis]